MTQRQPCNALSREWCVRARGKGWWIVRHKTEPWELGPIWRNVDAAIECADAVNEGRAYFRNIPMVPLGSPIPRTGEE